MLTEKDMKMYRDAEELKVKRWTKKLAKQLEDNFEKYNQDGLCTLDNFFKGTDFESYLSADAHLKGVVNWNRTKEGAE